MKLKPLLLIFSFAFSLSVIAQSDLRIGEWSAHIPYNTGVTVTQSPTHIYYGTEFALMSVLKTDSSQVSFFSKVDGLNDVEPSWIKFHGPLNTLIIGYKSGNIDLLTGDGISNINDIVRNTSIQGDKQIKHIYVDAHNRAFLSTPFGLLILNLTTGKFISTVFTNSIVNAFTEYQGWYYVATESGIYRYNPASGNIIENFSQWEKIIIPALPVSYTSEFIAEWKGSLYAGGNGALYRRTGEESFTFYHQYPNQKLKYISNESETLITGYRCNADCAGKVAFFTENNFWHDNGVNCAGRPNFAIEDEFGRIWYADNFSPIKLAQNHFTPCDPLIYDTPFSSNVSELEVKDGKLYVATGGVSESYGYQGFKDGFYIFDRIHWDIYNQFIYPELEGQGVENFFRILPHPSQNKVYVGSYYGGIVEYDFENFTIYNDTNSSLQGAEGDELRERVTGLAFDKQQNLWISNYIAPRPLSVLKANGEWRSFDLPCSNIKNLSQLVVDQRGYKWITLYSRNAGVIVYDDRGTIDDDSDDRCIALSASNTEMPTNSVYSIAVDLDGDIWVGTAEGPVVFDGGGDIFNGHRGSRIKVEQDGVLNYLFGEETIYSITVDGANRKWFGTGSGIFVQSPAGNEEVAKFNTQNSPLLDNRIIDIAIDNHNGLVYVATDGGIMSFRSDAIAGGPVHSANVYAFPNPVRPDYDGPIAIRGLARDAVVKITDIRGQMVHESRALGGQAIWDGRDLHGQRAETGVYLVFSTAGSDGFNKPDALVTKILVVK